MKFRIEAKWPSSDILPQAKEAESATMALKACATFLRAGCNVLRIDRVDEAGGSVRMHPHELLRLARDEGCGIRYPPRVREARRSIASTVFVILCSILPGNWGDFAVTDFSAPRVVVRRSEGIRSRATPRPAGTQPSIRTYDDGRHG